MDAKIEVPRMLSRRSQLLDLFLSYAEEDKEEVAEPLANELTRQGWSVWYAPNKLVIGDRLDKIEEGLGACRFGVVVLSPSFFTKEWTLFELESLKLRERFERRDIILPVRHRMDLSEVARYSLALANRVSISTNEGIPALAEAISRALRRQKAR
jgi:hypothetical protein